MTEPLPEIVSLAAARARDLGFELSCEPGVGRLLAALAAAVPRDGRIVELGTGAGAGLAWLVHGLSDRSDVSVVSVDLDRDLQSTTAAANWPAYVRFECGDGAERVRALGDCDLIFADAPGGKLDGLEHTIAALRPGGVLVVDDMDPEQHHDPELVAALAGVRETLLSHPDLIAAELACSSGLLLATRRGTP